MTDPQPLFFITGLPRSRTAFAANLFTTGRITCRHEFSADLSDPAYIIPALRNLRGRFVGTADTAAPLYLEKILEKMPEIPVIILDRDPAEVEKSLRKVLEGLYAREMPSLLDGHRAPAERIHATLERIPTAIAKLSEGLERIRRFPRVISLPWWMLDEPSAVRDMQEHIAPGEPFDFMRLDMLRNFRIEITPSRWQTLLRSDVLAKR